ncbi:uncharacterized protein LOC122385098 [Amphibalanus amphitrite]|uniref:uncharacterized protein LOC122385098 n=1 Tax=Amphibalanus amphitrite TaxID=1232801 RepID=UPI001C90FD2B|nr:uncharacterized protein LOC122385098 [Amphibalanus amphitrite]
MAKEYPLSTRYRAVGMVNGGTPQVQVAKELRIEPRTLRRWMALDRKGEALENRAGRGRKTAMSRVAKIVVAKSVTKRHQSTRKLARKLSAKNHPASKSAVHRYLRQCLRLKPLKPRVEPKLHGSTATKTNDRVWAQNSSEVPVIETVKQPGKVLVWGMMSFRGLSDLHIVPRGQTVTADYYVEEVMKGTAASAMRRRKENGPPTAIKLLPDMSQAIFQQDGAPAHNATKTQEWCRANFPGFWAKGEWPGNSPDLSPIENLWAIVQDRMDKMAPASSETALIRNLRSAWSSISGETLDNLMCGMPERMRACVRKRGGYINK